MLHLFGTTFFYKLFGITYYRSDLIERWNITPDANENAIFLRRKLAALVLKPYLKKMIRLINTYYCKLFVALTEDLWNGNDPIVRTDLLTNAINAKLEVKSVVGNIILNERLRLLTTYD